MLATPKWMGLFSFALTISLSDDPAGLRRELSLPITPFLRESGPTKSSDNS